MKLTVTSSEDGIAHIMCEGTIAAAHGRGNANPFEELLGPGCYGFKALLNLEKSSAIDSTGVAWLIRSHQNFQKGGGMLILHSMPPTVDHVLKLLNLHFQMHHAANVQAALRLAKGEEA